MTAKQLYQEAYHLIRQTARASGDEWCDMPSDEDYAAIPSRFFEAANENWSWSQAHNPEPRYHGVANETKCFTPNYLSRSYHFPRPCNRLQVEKEKREWQAYESSVVEPQLEFSARTLAELRKGGLEFPEVEDFES